VVAAGEEGRRAMGEAGRRRSVEEWNWPRLLDRMDASYEEAIEARAAKMRA